MLVGSVLAGALLCLVRRFACENTSVGAFCDPVLATSLDRSLPMALCPKCVAEWRQLPYESLPQLRTRNGILLENAQAQKVFWAQPGLGVRIRDRSIVPTSSDG